MTADAATKGITTERLLTLPSLSPEGGTDPLTEEEVRGFFAEIIERTKQATKTGDWQPAIDWMQDHFATQARFATEGRLTTAGGREFSYRPVIQREHVQVFPALAGAGPLGCVMDAVEDYSAVTDVTHVEILPNGEAAAAVEIRESATIGAGRLHGVLEAIEAGQRRRTNDRGQLTLESSSICEVRLAKTRTGNIVIRLGNCVTKTTV